MNASEIIRFLQRHPEACGCLGIRRFMTPGFHVAVHQDISIDDKPLEARQPERYRRWLAGLAQEYADEHGIRIGQSDDGVRYWAFLLDRPDVRLAVCATRLEALFCGIEEAIGMRPRAAGACCSHNGTTWWDARSGCDRCVMCNTKVDRGRNRPPYERGDQPQEQSR